MYCERYWPTRHWPVRHWPIPSNFIAYLRTTVRNRRLREKRWNVTLISSAGTRYGLGWVDIEDGSAASISIPVTVPDGTYDVEVKSTGLAWEDLIQKNTAAITIDRASSTPITVGFPLFTDFRYDISKGWLRLQWNGDIPLNDSGLVSAGLWFTAAVPDFGTTPDVTIPLFSFQSVHEYIVQEESSFNYVGLAPIDNDGVVGTGQYISIEDRSVTAVNFVVEEG